MLIRETGTHRHALVTGALCAALGLATFAGPAWAATMPDVDGLNLADAQSAVKTAGLGCSYIEANGTEALPFMPANWTVVGASRDGGADVADGSKVTLVIEKSGRSYDPDKTSEVIAQVKAGTDATDAAAQGQTSDTQTGFSIESFLDSLRLDQLIELRDNVNQRISALQAALPQTEDASAEQAADAQAPTLAQSNALKSAQGYLKFMAFSRSGLINQLEYEGYSTEDATWAADNCGADWNEQAAKSAQSYLDFTSFSRSGLIDQLVYEGFTAEQAEYGVTAVGY